MKQTPIQHAIDEFKFQRDRGYREAISSLHLIEDVDRNIEEEVLHIVRIAVDVQVERIYQEWLSLDLRASRKRKQMDEELDRFAWFLIKIR